MVGFSNYNLKKASANLRNDNDELESDVNLFILDL